ncbi:MAG: hypothetical protein WKF64_08455 [Ilumatobacteraceae bacterium]
MIRNVQQSLLPDVVPDRPVGRILPSVITGTNADLIAAIAPLYLTGAVCDVTHGEGGWWRKLRPEHLVAHDLDSAKGDGVDFTALPEADDTYDAVTFDPPYIPQGGYDTSTAQPFADRFGLTSRSPAELWILIEAGLAECSRVSRRWVLVKCMDFVSGGSFHLGHVKVIELGAMAGLRVHDLLVHHTGSGPGGHNIFTPLRARRNHSYLIVFEVRS